MQKEKASCWTILHLTTRVPPSGLRDGPQDFNQTIHHTLTQAPVHELMVSGALNSEALF